MDQMKDRLLAAARQAAIMLAVICAGTVFDWLVHRTSPRFDVPSDYFPNKIIFGMLIGFIAFQVFRLFIKSAGWLAFATTLTIAILLPVNYYL